MEESAEAKVKGVIGSGLLKTKGGVPGGCYSELVGKGRGMANDGTTNSKGCQMTNEDGQPCSAPPMSNGNFCFFNDPEKAQQRESARRAGGIERTRRVAVLPADTQDRHLRSIGELVELLRDATNWTIRGQLDPKVAYAVSHLVSIQIKALGQCELERRLAALETLVRQRPTDEDTVLAEDPQKGDAPEGGG
jgi:hypothetical protein